MSLCTKHPHSSEVTASLCFIRRLQAKAAKRTRGFRSQIDMVRHPKGRKVVRDGIELIVFSEDENMPY